MKKVLAISLALFFASLKFFGSAAAYYDTHPFGTETKYALDADNAAIGEWWKLVPDEEQAEKAMRDWFRSIPREEALAFALYTHDQGVLKLTAQCFPLLPEEPKSAVLEVEKNGYWHPLQVSAVQYPGWDLHFRVENWDSTQDIPYRIRLGDLSEFSGLIRHDPVEKETIVVAVMSCNSPRDLERFSRAEIVHNLIQQNPDLLFFAGDQNYTHDEATYGWLQFGVQFRDVIKDRPTICIPDDHDVGHGNLWGEGGKASSGVKGASDGGYMYPASFVKMVERQMTSNLPDPFDPTPVKQGIGVYYTDLLLGEISFAILEDRKFKSAPYGNIPEMGPRPDHIVDPSYDPSLVDLPHLKLLGERQLTFLDDWSRDWEGSAMKVALSQTAFAGAVHLHGNRDNRLVADLDCNGWPQSGRDKALRLLRRAHASHFCGDQHLAAVIQHGIEGFRDGPIAFTGPALVNTIYGRWWWPDDEKPGSGDPIDSPLPWVGDYLDGLGNKITMMAYANPDQSSNQMLQSKDQRLNRKDGYGLARFTKSSGKIVFECWPRFADLSRGDAEQFTGWPIEFNTRENDGRQPIGYLEEVALPYPDAVVELINDTTSEVVYCFRVRGDRFKAPVYTPGHYTLRAGRDRGEKAILFGSIAP